MRFSAALLRFALCIACSVALAAAQQSNVLLVLADDLGVDAVGVYGEGTNPPWTPRIDALAAAGVLFRNAWANPLCSPTRACIQTGRYSFRTGVGRPIPTLMGLPPQNVLRLTEITLPELLDARQTGYAHALIGKWHLGDETNGGDLGPNMAGWSHFAGLIQGWSDYFDWRRTVNGESAMTTVYSTSRIVDDALTWMETAPEPWFCHVSFTAPHDPYHAPPAALHTQNLEGLDPQVDRRPFFRAMVEAMDTELGRLLDSMDPAVWARTTVIFVGDNGTAPEVSVPPFSSARAKGTAHEGALNVPLIVSGPAVQGALPREESALVSTVDLFATVGELCGADPALPVIAIDAVSFVPYLAAAGQPPLRSTVFAETFFDGDPTGSGFAAVRNATHKLIRNFDQQPPLDELYDLVADPFETVDLLAMPPLSPADQAQYDALDAALVATRDTSGSVASYGSTTCSGSNGNPAIAIRGVPQVMSSYDIDLRNGAALQPAFLFIGISDRDWRGIPLPFALSQIGGGPGCAIHASGEFVLPLGTDAAGAATFSLALPGVPELIGGQLFHCWLVADPGAPGNPLQLTASDGARVVVGS